MNILKIFGRHQVSVVGVTETWQQEDTRGIIRTFIRHEYWQQINVQIRNVSFRDTGDALLWFFIIRDF